MLSAIRTCRLPPSNARLRILTSIKPHTWAPRRGFALNRPAPLTWREHTVSTRFSEDVPDQMVDANFLDGMDFYEILGVVSAAPLPPCACARVLGSPKAAHHRRDAGDCGMQIRFESALECT